VEAETRYCYRHPDRETGLSCSECGRPICYECMTPAPVGLRCPEHSGKPQGVRKVTAAAERAVTGAGSRRAAPVTIALVAINVAVYLVELALGGTASGTGNKLFYDGALFAHRTIDYHGQLYAMMPNASDGVADGGWWRLITAPFLHYGPIHLGLNMLALYWYGPVLEHVIGRWRYLLLYVAAGLAGSAGALWLTPNAVTVGASGAIFGVFGALLVLERERIILSGGQILGLIVLNLVFTFGVSGLSLALGTTGISIGGHIGGLIAGFSLMWLYLRVRRSAPLSIACATAVAIASVVLAYAVV
jgi:membrane associated rhomboid family serine protease